jgi:peptidoglycan/xylan/chitin deacetylase (PgdA/CDA1 family)
VLALLDREYGESARPYDEQFRPLSQSELRELAACPGSTIGSHAHRHDILTYLPAERLASSVVESREILERLTGHEIHDIAYPNGDQNLAVREACRAAGYRRGYMTGGAIAPRHVDPLRIPRILVGGYDTVSDLLAKINRALLAASFGRTDAASQSES